MNTIEKSKIEEIITVCPYCMECANNKRVCCGEVHFETAYVVDGEYYLESEVHVSNKDSVK